MFKTVKNLNVSIFQVLSSLFAAVLFLVASADQEQELKNNTHDFIFSLRQQAGAEMEGDERSPTAVGGNSQLAGWEEIKGMTTSLTNYDYEPQGVAMRSLVAAWGNWGDFDVAANSCTWGDSVSCDEKGILSGLYLFGIGLRGNSS